MPGTVFLDGESIELRTIEKEDIEFLRDGVNHPEVRVHMGNTRPQNLEKEQDFFEHIVETDDEIHLLICKSNEPMGIVSVTDKEEPAKIGEVGIWLHPDYHGNGYGTEASKLIVKHCFEQLNYHKLYARAHADNKPSQSIWKKLGFQREGRLRDHVYTQGQYKDVLYYGLLRGER